MRDTNNLHPSCATAPAPDSPMEVGDSLELEELTLVRGAHDHLLERGDQQSRRDRDRRGENRGTGGIGMTGACTGRGMRGGIGTGTTDPGAPTPTGTRLATQDDLNIGHIDEDFNSKMCLMK